MTRVTLTSNDLIDSAKEKSPEMVVVDDLKFPKEEILNPDFIFFVDLRPFFPTTRTLKTSNVNSTTNN